MKILVPTDFSPTAEKSFRFAVDLAAKTKGTIILYHNFIPVESTFIGTEKTRKHYNTQHQENIIKRLQRLKKKVMGDRTDLSVSTIVDRSPLMANILDFANHNHIDMIVMGTQGASGLKKTIIGSVAARVIEKSDLPVLLVPSKYELEEVREIIFATNYQVSDKQAFKLVNALEKLYKAETTVLHFQNIYNTESEKKKEKKDFDSYADSLQREFNESKINFRLLETSSVIETLETLDKIFPYDLIIMVRRKKSFLEKFFIKSFTQNMAYVSKKPLLIVPGVE